MDDQIKTETDYLTNADIVALGEAVLTHDGKVVGFDHAVVERIVQRCVRADREDLAGRINANADEFASAASDKRAAVLLVALLIQMVSNA